MIARKFYWKGYRRDVRRWIKSCLVCARRKPHRPTRAGKRQSLGASAPFRTVAIDCVGPYTPDADGNCYLLTGIDVFTRWPFAIPIRNERAETVARALYRGLIRDHGCPRIIRRDRGACFIDKGYS